MKKIVIGVSGGIAAFKTLELIKLLKSKSIDVSVIMTAGARRMLDSKLFEQVFGNKVYFELFEDNFDYKQILEKRKVEHIDLADSADLIVIVPATANIIGKIAAGIADDYLTTTVLAASSPVIICPSMNVNMWNNPIVRENVRLLASNGFQFLGPDSGMLACGYTGEGRLMDVAKICEEIMRQLEYTHSLKNKKVIVTAGGTIEKIDDVRYLANRSSGKMGIAIAEECYLRGAKVLLLRAKSSVKPRYLMDEKTFSSADDLDNLITDTVDSADIFIHTAAVSDFIPEVKSGKLSSDATQVIKLKPSKKILNKIRKLNKKVYLIAFKAESGLSEDDLIKQAKHKLVESGADMVVANDVGKANSGFESDNNEVIIIRNSGKTVKLSYSSKLNIAKQIVDLIFSSALF